MTHRCQNVDSRTPVHSTYPPTMKEPDHSQLCPLKLSRVEPCLTSQHRHKVNKKTKECKGNKNIENAYTRSQHIWHAQQKK